MFTRGTRHREKKGGADSLGRDRLLDGLGRPPAGRLQVRGGEGLLLDGRAAGAGAALEVVLEPGVQLVARGIVGQVLVDGELQLALAVALVAVQTENALDGAMES